MHTTMPFSHRAVYDPDTLRMLCSVFDNAWDSIAYNFDGASREAARLKLATIILRLTTTGDRDVLELRCRAIGQMQYAKWPSWPGGSCSDQCYGDSESTYGG